MSRNYQQISLSIYGKRGQWNVSRGLKMSRTTAHSCDMPFLSKIGKSLDTIFTLKKGVSAKCQVVRGEEKSVLEDYIKAFF